VGDRIGARFREDLVLTMAIETARGRTMRIAASSASGTVFCMQRTAGEAIRYGSAQPDAYGGSTPSVFKRAIALCGTTPWSDAAVRRLDTATLCDGLDRAGGYVLCRMVQVQIVDTMRQTKLT